MIFGVQMLIIRYFLMLNDLSILAVIPARKGSKGVPGKNLRLIGGRSLLELTINAANESVLLDRIALSSDCERMLAIGESLACCPLRRPPALATDSARTIHVLHHAIRSLGGRWDYVVQLQPTSPFRTSQDIDAAIRLCINLNAPACVSVTPVKHNPHMTFAISNNGRIQSVFPSLKNLSRRQDMPRYYQLNGAIYVASVAWALRRESLISDDTVAYVMPQERSLDIDSENDLILGEILFNKS